MITLWFDGLMITTITKRDFYGLFDLLLEKSGSVSIHHRNLAEKTLNNLSAPLSDLFKVKETKYSLRERMSLVSNNVKTTNFDINRISYLGQEIWDQIPVEIKESKT